MISLSFNMKVLHETIRNQEQTKNKNLKAKIKKQQIVLFKCLFLFIKSFMASKKTSTFQLTVDNTLQSCGHLWNVLSNYACKHKKNKTWNMNTTNERTKWKTIVNQINQRTKTWNKTHTREKKDWLPIISMLMTHNLHSILSWNKSFFHPTNVNIATGFVGEFFFFQCRKIRNQIINNQA